MVIGYLAIVGAVLLLVVVPLVAVLGLLAVPVSRVLAAWWDVKRELRKRQ